MNKGLISLQWLLSIGLLGLLLSGQQAMDHYDPAQNLIYAAIGYMVMTLLVSFMTIKNRQDGFFHISIGLVGTIVIFKLFQVSLLKVWPVYLSMIGAGFVLMLLQESVYRGWGVWTYLLLVYVVLPLNGLMVYFRNKLILTTVLDNDLSIVNGVNPLFSGIGYLATGYGAKNYLGYGPLHLLILTVLLIYLPTKLKITHIRKDENNEKITL